MNRDRKDNPVPEEPKNRFYVRKWQATQSEMSAIRDYVRSRRSDGIDEDHTGVEEAKRIKSKVVRQPD